MTILRQTLRRRSTTFSEPSPLQGLDRNVWADGRAPIPLAASETSNKVLSDPLGLPIIVPAGCKQARASSREKVAPATN